MTYNVSIEFCMQWNYAPKAASFAEELFTHFRHKITSIELIPSSGGAFEISVNGQMMHSKLQSGSYPDVQAFIQDMENTK